MAEIKGLDELLRKLKKLPEGASPKGGGPLERAMRKGAGVWVDAAKARVASKGPGVKNSRTGNTRLKDSIALRKDPDPRSNNADVRFEVGYKAAAYWGAFVEMGTEKQSAHPFLRPAFDENRDEILRVIVGQLRKDIEKAAR